MFTVNNEQENISSPRFNGRTYVTRRTALLCVAQVYFN